MFIETDIIVQETSPCMAEKGTFKAKTIAPRMLDEIFPYLNATIKSGVLRVGSFEYSKDGIVYVLMENQINIKKFLNNTHLYELLEELTDLLNDTWEKREEITPDSSLAKNISPLEVFKHLPRMNCKQCGFANCMAFAGQISRRTSHLDECPHLTGEQISLLEQIL